MTQFIQSDGAKFELGYWCIRGLGQPIRFLLVYADVQFSETRLGIDDDGRILDYEEEGEDWSVVKAALDMPFPNLPYLIDRSGPDVIQVAQSNAILRYLARRFDFYGDSESDRIEIDVMQEEAYDFRNKIVKTAYTLGEECQSAFDEFKKTAVPRHLDGLEKYLSQRNNQTCFVGNRISLVDFVLYELIWQVSLMVPGSVSTVNRPVLANYIAAFSNLPQIAEYMKSQHYIERPINSPWASFF
jgi:glutathione S-transferase